MSSCSRIGLFGGTFDPIHNAHLEVARQSLAQMNLSKVILIPSKHPPHKSEEGMTEAEVRYEMVKLAVKGRDKLEVSPVEINREGPSYTIDTLKEMKDVYGKIAFIVGADNLINIDTWKEPEKLLASCPFIVAPRGGILKGDFEKDIFEGKELRFLNMSEISLSSTGVRKRIMEGQPVDGMVPERVRDFIQKRDLYREVPEEVSES
ncbi:MAG: nicotinate-nucleotide adenylyltransferase [Candidatus Bipolaricaulia bacterium]